MTEPRPAAREVASVVRFDAAVGYAGAPVFDAGTDRVVGVLWGGRSGLSVVRTPGEGNAEYAVPLSDLESMLRSGPSRLTAGKWPRDLAFIR